MNPKNMNDGVGLGMKTQIETTLSPFEAPILRHCAQTIGKSRQLVVSSSCPVGRGQTGIQGAFRPTIPHCRVLSHPM